MIIPNEKLEQLVDTSSIDEPPAYTDSISPSASTSARFPEKSAPVPSLPLPGPSAGEISKRVPTPSSSSSSSSLAAWFSFGALSRTDKEVKATVLGLVRDVVKQTSTPSAVSILQSCAEACRARNLPFDQILQEPSIEGHTPLYWAILKQPSPLPSTPDPEEIGILDLLLSFPLTEATRADASDACVLKSDNVLFSRLRLSPGWKSSISGAEDMLRGEGNDEIRVTHDPKSADTGAFRAEFHVELFQMRMRVSRKIRLEFVARERLWVLTFSREPPRAMRHPRSASSGNGSGYVNLHLLDPSPGTPLKGRIVVLETARNVEKSSRSRPITIPLKTSAHHNLTPQKWGKDHGICVSLADVPGGPSLQYDGSSFINADGSLDFEFDAVLSNSDGDADCVIM